MSGGEQSGVSPLLVRCVCVTASLSVTSCALLGLGLTCVLLVVFDEEAASCPHHVTVVVFSVAGALAFLSIVLLTVMCRRRTKFDGGNKKSSGPDREAPKQESDKMDNKTVERQISDDSFDMAQKSEEVSQWIEQQKSAEPTTPDIFPLDSKDGATNAVLEKFTLEPKDVATTNDADHESLNDEMTAL